MQRHGPLTYSLYVYACTVHVMCWIWHQSRNTASSSITTQIPWACHIAPQRLECIQSPTLYEGFCAAKRGSPEFVNHRKLGAAESLSSSLRALQASQRSQRPKRLRKGPIWYPRRKTFNFSGTNRCVEERRNSSGLLASLTKQQRLTEYRAGVHLRNR
jgi:hypothetical protein